MFDMIGVLVLNNKFFEWSCILLRSIGRILKLICLLVLTAIAAAFILHLDVGIKSKVIINGGPKTVIYNVKLFERQYVMKCNGINILTFRLLEDGENIKVDKLKTGSKVYALCSSNSCIDVYSSDGGLVSSYTVNNRVILSLCTGDINLDGTDEILIVTGKKGENMEMQYL
jgi:hypothetical protein